MLLKFIIVAIVVFGAYYFLSGNSIEAISIQLPTWFGKREMIILLIVIVPLIIVYSIGNARGGGRGGRGGRSGPPPSMNNH